jgi:hypothetical protein
MGALPEEKEPELDFSLTYLVNIFKTMKFSRIRNDDGFLLIARDVIKWNDINAYSELSGYTFAPWEAETIMSIDGIFTYSRGE